MRALTGPVSPAAPEATGGPALSGDRLLRRPFEPARIPPGCHPSRRTPPQCPTWEQRRRIQSRTPAGVAGSVVGCFGYGRFGLGIRKTSSVHRDPYRTSMFRTRFRSSGIAVGRERAWASALTGVAHAHFTIRSVNDVIQCPSRDDVVDQSLYFGGRNAGSTCALISSLRSFLKISNSSTVHLVTS